MTEGRGIASCILQNRYIVGLRERCERRCASRDEGDGLFFRHRFRGRWGLRLIGVQGEGGVYSIHGRKECGGENRWCL